MSCFKKGSAQSCFPVKSFQRSGLKIWKGMCGKNSGSYSLNHKFLNGVSKQSRYTLQEFENTGKTVRQLELEEIAIHNENADEVLQQKELEKTEEINQQSEEIAIHNGSVNEVLEREKCPEELEQSEETKQQSEEIAVYNVTVNGVLQQEEFEKTEEIKQQPEEMAVHNGSVKDVLQQEKSSEELEKTEETEQPEDIAIPHESENGISQPSQENTREKLEKIRKENSSSSNNEGEMEIMLHTENGCPETCEDEMEKSFSKSSNTNDNTSDPEINQLYNSKTSILSDDSHYITCGEFSFGYSYRKLENLLSDNLYGSNESLSSEKREKIDEAQPDDPQADHKIINSANQAEDQINTISKDNQKNEIIPKDNQFNMTKASVNQTNRSCLDYDLIEYSSINLEELMTRVYDNFSQMSQRAFPEDHLKNKIENCKASFRRSWDETKEGMITNFSQNKDSIGSKKCELPVSNKNNYPYETQV